MWSLHILSLIFCLPPPLFSTHTHFEPALLQCTSIHSNQAILQLICQSFCSMLYSLRHVQTQQGNHISPACLWGERENYPLFIINITKTKGMLGRGLEYKDKYSPLVWSLLLYMRTASAQDNHISESILDNEWKNTCWSLYFNKVNAENFLCCSGCWEKQNCISLWRLLKNNTAGKGHIQCI